MVFNEVFKKYIKFLENEEVERLVYKTMISYQIPSKYKGFKYFKDIIVISLQDNSYSMQPMAKYFDFIAYEYDIENFSVQRQLRYSCTIKGCCRVPIDLYTVIWRVLQNKVVAILEKQKEEKLKNASSKRKN